MNENSHSLNGKKIRNGLLCALSVGDMELIAPHLESMPMPLRMNITEPERKIEAAYFLEDGIASMVLHSMRGEQQIEVGICGRDGMAGTALLHDVKSTSEECFMQVAGAGHRIAAAALTSVCQASPSLHRMLLRYSFVSRTQLACTALANGRYRIEERLARWVLMCDDRIEGGTVALTHEFLALMLGVQRPGVTLALQVLEGRGMLRGQRGRITVLNRKMLVEAAGGSYGIPEAEYARLIGPM